MEAVWGAYWPASKSKNCNTLTREREKELVARCQTGELVAFNELLNHYRERIINLAFQILGDANAAEDVAQEVFITTFSKIHQFRGDAALFTWLYRITVRSCCQYSKPRNFELNPIYYPADTPDQTPSPEKTIIFRLSVQRSLEKLSPSLRSVLVLREMQGLTYDEIAEVLEIPIGTVRSRLHEARRNFRDIWEAL